LRAALLVTALVTLVATPARANDASAELEAMLARSRTRRATLGSEVGRRRARRQRREMNRRARERYRVHATRARATDMRERIHERALVAPASAPPATPTRVARRNAPPPKAPDAPAPGLGYTDAAPRPTARTASRRDDCDCPPAVGPDPRIVEVPAPGLPIAPAVERARATLAEVRARHRDAPLVTPSMPRSAPAPQAAPDALYAHAAESLTESAPVLPRQVGPNPTVTRTAPLPSPRSAWTRDLDALLRPTRGVAEVGLGGISGRARDHGVDDIQVMHDLMIRDALRRGEEYPGFVPRRALSD
jgi:hypothetical protein